MKKGLAVPLTMAQIEAANELHQGLPQWENTDDALHVLHNRFPEFDIKATPLKVAAVNQLYGTNVYAVDRMARHIVEVLSARDSLRDIDLVEELADVDAQGQQPEMQAGRKRRRRGVIVKDRSVIQGDAPWQARGELGASEHELIGFHGWIGRIETGVALDLEAAHYINNGNQTDFPYSRYVHAVLGIEFPLVMRCPLRLDR
jgi:hypothetical protein